MRLLRRIREQYSELKRIPYRLHLLQESIGRIEARQTLGSFSGDLGAVEFRVFSQWGEDGIIQAIVNLIKPPVRTFIEFGVQNYCESNTRFLLINNNWSGLVLDGSPENVEYIRKDPIYWQYNLKAECAFITRENIDQLLSRAGLNGEVGLLSIDIDGNDYWVWRSIKSIRPAIVVTEYNARFGSERAVTVPYLPSFRRSEAHYSNIYYGASLQAMCLLGRSKGYALIGCNSAGNNAFFVRHDLLKSPLSEKTADEAFVRNQFREARQEDGALAPLTSSEELALLNSLPLVDVFDKFDAPDL